MNDSEMDTFSSDASNMHGKPRPVLGVYTYPYKACNGSSLPEKTTEKNVLVGFVLEQENGFPAAGTMCLSIAASRCIPGFQCLTLFRAVRLIIYSTCVTAKTGKW